MTTRPPSVPGMPHVCSMPDRLFCIASLARLGTHMPGSATISKPSTATFEKLVPICIITMCISSSENSKFVVLPIMRDFIPFKYNHCRTLINSFLLLGRITMSAFPPTFHWLSLDKDTSNSTIPGNISLIFF